MPCRKRKKLTKKSVFCPPFPLVQPRHFLHFDIGTRQQTVYRIWFLGFFFSQKGSRDHNIIWSRAAKSHQPESEYTTMRRKAFKKAQADQDTDDNICVIQSGSGDERMRRGSVQGKARSRNTIFQKLQPANDTVRKRLLAPLQDDEQHTFQPFLSQIWALRHQKSP